MDKNLIEKYKNEMRRMYNSANAPIRTTATEIITPAPPPQNTDTTTGTLLGIVTAIRSLYPVKNAKVTIFKGNYPDMQVIDSDFTNESGRTKIFTLPTPAPETNTRTQRLFGWQIKTHTHIRWVRVFPPKPKSATRQ